MRLRTSLTFWSATFFGSLGLSPLVACGGVMKNDGPDGVGGNGTSASGGGGTGGVFTETGGYAMGGFGAGGVLEGSGFGGVGIGGAFIGNGGTGGAFTGSGGAGGAAGSPACVAVLDPNAPVGFASCMGGSLHRISRTDCPQPAPACDYVGDASAPPGQCLRDADCGSAPHGRCNTNVLGAGCYCDYGCVRDADCDSGKICLCGNPQCVPATCATDADCGDGLLCLSYIQGCRETAFACQTPHDQCVSNADCVSTIDSGYATCTLINGQHVCQSQVCVGRPFLVGGSVRTAELVRRRDWSSSLCPVVDGLGSAVRAELATRWTEVALMEHASIASFARFALEIMSLGAPPELLVATHSAMVDETVHARDAFALASAYAGHAVGPGALDVGAALLARTPLDIVRKAILEGCIGETVAAVEAAEALAHATDPAVRAALERVVVDETKHAELAWRFVKWVLEHADAKLAREAATCLVDVIDAEVAGGRRGPTIPSTRSDEMLRAHGALDDATRSEIRRRVVRDVIAPCARALAFQSRSNKNTNAPAPLVA